MIKNPQKIKLKWTKNNKKHYLSKGYNFTNFGDELIVDVLDLPLGSHQKVEMICDFCGAILIKQFRQHSEQDSCVKCKYHKSKITNLKKYGVEHPMQSKEVQEKSEKTMLEKYGVKHALQNKDIFEKVKQGNVEKYGVEFLSQNEEIREKIKKTNIERYGVEKPLQNHDIKKKQEITCFDKFGDVCPARTQEIKEKSKQINLEKYGTEFAVQSDVVQKKIKQTNLEKYGVEYAICSQEVRDKTKNTLIEKYGTDNAMKNKDVLDKMRQTCLEKYGQEYFVQTEEFKEKQIERLKENGNLVPWSKQQKRINTLIDGKMNYFQHGYFLDVALVDEKIDIEYDGSGHNLNVKFGKISQVEFEKKEKIRDEKLISDGWRIIRIKCPTDKLPNDELIIENLRESIEELKNKKQVVLEWR